MNAGEELKMRGLDDVSSNGKSFQKRSKLSSKNYYKLSKTTNVLIKRAEVCIRKVNIQIRFN